MKGFIGPLGDDLPSVVVIVLALTMFFAGLTFALNIYNQKLLSMDVLRGSVDIGRIITQDGLTSSDLFSYKSRAESTAKSYALNFSLYFADDPAGTQTGSCGPNWYKFNYLVAVTSTQPGLDVKLRTLVLCSGRSV